MDYQDLTEILGQSKTGTTPAPSLNSIIEGIQSQYQAIPAMPVQSALYGANRYVTGSPQFGEIQKMFEYGVLNQILGPNFVPSEFNIDTYRNVDTKKLSDLIGTLGNGGAFDYGGGDGGPSSTNGNSVDGTGLTSTPNVNPATIGALATIGGLVTGLPLGLVSTVVGKGTIANAINAQNHANDVANNTAFVAAQMGIANTPANAAAIAAAIDSLNSTPVGTTAATPGTTGTGGAAASAASAAAAAAAAAGHSDAAIGAASQAAAAATIGGASPANAASIGAVAAAAADSPDGSVSIGLDGSVSSSSADSTAADNSGIGGW